MLFAYQVAVSSLPIIPTDKLSSYDRCDQPWGVWLYNVVAENVKEAEELGLDLFHGSIAIDTLDDFEITARAAQIGEVRKP